MTAQGKDAGKADGKGTGQDPEPDAAPGQGPSEDMKRRFREALDKKHAHGGRDVSDDGKGNRIHGAHGAEGGPADVPPQERLTAPSARRPRPAPAAGRGLRRTGRRGSGAPPGWWRAGRPQRV